MRNDLGGHSHRPAIAPTTRMGAWGVALVLALVVLATALVVVVPADSLAAWIGASCAVALLIGSASVEFAAIRHGERAVSVWTAAAVLVGGVLFVLLHSLFISD